MTRSNAREIVLHLILDMDYTGEPASDVVSARMDQDYYKSLEAENDVYAERPNQKQMEYIKSVSAGVQEHLEELRGYISKYSIGWKLGRISRLARAILVLAMYEVLYVDDVPTSVAVNEAMELTKKYESAETAAFVNGILGAFVRGETGAQAEAAPADAAEETPEAAAEEAPEAAPEEAQEAAPAAEPAAGDGEV